MVKHIKKYNSSIVNVFDVNACIQMSDGKSQNNTICNKITK